MEEKGSVGCSSQTNLTSEPPHLTFIFFFHLQSYRNSPARIVCDVTQVHGDKDGHEDSGENDKGLAGAESLGGSKEDPY